MRRNRSGLPAWFGIAAALPLIMMAQEVRKKKPMTIAEIYKDAYKQATGEGEHHAGAHQRALEAVANEAQRAVKLHPFRAQLHRYVQRLERMVRP